MVNIYKRLSKRLKEAKEKLLEEELKAPEKPAAPEIKELPRPISLKKPPELIEAPKVPEIPKIPKIEPKKVVAKAPEAPKLIVPPQQVIVQAPVVKPEIVKEAAMEVPEGLETGRAFKMKYKPISMEIPEEFTEAAGKGLEAKKEVYMKKLRKIDEKVPLITLKTKGKEVVVSWANIKWNPASRSLIYYVYEPKLNDKLRTTLDEAKTLLRQKLDIDFTKIRIEKAYEYLMSKFDAVLNEMGAKITPKEKIILNYYVFRDFIGLGKIEPLLHDKNLEDIHCDGAGVPLFVTHRNPLYGEMQTNIIFKTKEELDSFVLRLAQKCGKALSIAEPLLDGALPDGSRVQITYGTDIAMRGSNFTIRKFTEKPITPIDELNYGTASPEILAYLWMAVESGLSMLIAGATATGKTSFLNALSMFINPELKIISIEDSVAGDTPFVFLNSNKYRQETIGNYIDTVMNKHGFEKLSSGHHICPNYENIKVPTIDFNNKLTFLPVNALIRHKVNKKGYEIITKTGKTIKVTEDHSLYILGPDIEKMSPKRFVKEIAQGNKQKAQINEDIAFLTGLTVTHGVVDKNKNVYYPKIKKLENILNKLGFKYKIRKYHIRISRKEFYDYLVSLGINLNSKWINERTPKWVVSLEGAHLRNFILGYRLGNKKKVYYIKPKLCKAKASKLRKGDCIISAKTLEKDYKGLECINLDLKNFGKRAKIIDGKVKVGSYAMPCKVKLDKDLLEFIGLWIADGCYDERGKYVIISAPKPETENVVKRICEKFKFKYKKHSDGVSLNIYGSIFYYFLKNELKLTHYAHHKTMPQWVNKLSNKQLAALLRGYFAGDNNDGKYEMGCASVSKKLIEDIQHLLLRFGIRSTIREKKQIYNLSISEINNIKKLEKIGFIRKDRLKRFKEITSRNKQDHDCSDIIDLPENFLIAIFDEAKDTWKSLKQRYKKKKIGRAFLKQIVKSLKGETKELLKSIIDADLYFEKIKKINKIRLNEYVYDFSVQPVQRFCTKNGILCSNTPELRLPHPNWIPEVARAGFGVKRYGEVTMFDLLKSALRQRPNYVIVGEVRGKEAYVMFQGMASVLGCEKIFVSDTEGNPTIMPIKELGKYAFKNWKAVTLNPGHEAKLLPVKAWARHGKRTKMIKIETHTGREVIVTPEHSLFTYDKKQGIFPIEANNLTQGSIILVPSKIPCNYKNIEYFDLTNLKGIRVLAPELIKKAVQKIGFKKACEICCVKSINDYYSKNACSALHSDKFKKLMDASKIDYSNEEFMVRFDRKSETFPNKLKISNELLRLIGYYLSEGTLNTANKNNSIALYNSDKKVLRDMKQCIKKVTGKTPKERLTKGWGKTLELRFNHKVLYEFLKQLCGLGSSNKKIPEFVFGLSKEKIGQVLAGMYAGDSNFSAKAITYYTKSKELANTLLYALLCLEIVGRVRSHKGIYEIKIYRSDFRKKLSEYVKPVNKKYVFKKARYLKNIIGDVYLDKVKNITEIRLKSPLNVYDISVPPTENFVGGFGGIMLHNTGHPSFGTLHADSVATVIDRLTTEPINLPKAMLENLDLIVFLILTKRKGEYVRRVNEIVEILGYDPKTRNLITNRAFRWDPEEDKFVLLKSVLLDKIREKLGYTIEELKLDMLRRIKLLKWLQKHKITDYKEVARYFKMYYTSPEKVDKLVRRA